VVRKDAMLSQLYSIDEAEPDQKIIDVFICKLRKKLAAAGAAGLISTVWGAGYRLEELTAEDDTLAARAGLRLAS
jgi:two-component system cell cycle response regulator CtrA